MTLVMIVRGEEELGPQRFCPGCQCWWPDDGEFFVVWPTWRSDDCRACIKARREARAAIRAAQERAVAQDAMRATWRRQQAAWRARVAR